jgi:TetR/AcrR family transcriptional regulator, cholesterol catabolism regulator
VLNVGAWHNAPLMTGTDAVQRGDLELGDEEDAAGESPPREQQVRAAALRLFRDKGYHATSMRDIAAEVGINKGSLYSYIRSKEDLLIPFFERAMGLLLAEIEAISADESLTATERLKRAIKAHILNVTENLDILTVYLSEWRQLRADSLSTVRQQRERYAALFLTIVEDGVRRGEFRAIDPRISALGMIGMCNYLFRWYRPDGRLRPEQIADELTDMLLHGVLA